MNERMNELINQLPSIWSSLACISITYPSGSSFSASSISCRNSRISPTNRVIRMAEEVSRGLRATGRTPKMSYGWGEWCMACDTANMAATASTNRPNIFRFVLTDNS